jgi:hypothetical protein
VQVVTEDVTKGQYLRFIGKGKTTASRTAVDIVAFQLSLLFCKLSLFKGLLKQSNVDKIGNLIIYLVDKINEIYRQKVYLTKLLKVLYIIDETAIKETGAPVTGLDYRVWKMGSVAFDVYRDLMHEKSGKLSLFAKAKKDPRTDPR